MQEQRLLVGRGEEQGILNAAYDSNQAEFVAIYGRRRIGKTYLVKTVFNTHADIFFHVTGTQNAAIAEQIDDFMTVLEATFYHHQIKIERPKTWKKAFESLTNTILREAKGKKIVLFFDELPWLASKRSRFIQALDYYWNRHWVDLPYLKLIVCGSSASWMLKHVISHKGGLHNRLSRKIALAPFNLYETKQYLAYKHIPYHPSQLLDIFMVTGGIPYYLSFLKPHLSAAQNIDQLCFQHNGELVNEFKQLYASLFHQSPAYEELIRIIATKRYGIEQAEMAALAKLSSDGGRLKERLAALEASSFIVSFRPYGHTKRGTYYRVIDEYSLFYIHWIEPALSTIKKLDKTNGYWLEKSASAAWRSWAGYAFEAVCYKHLMQIRQALTIGPSAEVGNWRYVPKDHDDAGAQIDLIFDRPDGVITLCEIKHSINAFQLTKEEAQQLIKKEEIFKKKTKTNKPLQWALITNHAIKKTMYSEDLIAHQVTLTDLLK